MATVTTVAANSITSTSANLRGSFTSGELCCTCPCCTFTTRFFYGLTSSMGSVLNDTSFCSCCDFGDCAPCTGTSFAATATGLTPDETYHFQARTQVSGCGGSCNSNDGGSILTFKTCAGAMSFGSPANQPPTDTTVQVSISFNPNVNESSASLKVQYKLDTEPTNWTDGDTQTGIQSSGTRTFTITGLTPATLYDFRFVATRNAASCSDNSETSSEGAFTTAASALTDSLQDTLSLTSVLAGDITGQAVLGDDEITIEETAEILLLSGDATVLSGVWFYHLPTQSYWFWDLDNMTAGALIVNDDNVAHTVVALGSEVYIVDDETYSYDDRNQLEPISDNDQSEIRLSLVPRTIDGGGGYLAPRSLSVKWGASPDVLDPLGKVDIDLVTDVYPKRPTPPDARVVLATRRVDIAPDEGGLDEWRHYSVGRVAASNVIGFRFSFPTGLTPHRRNPIRIDRVIVNAVQTPMRRRRI